MTEKNPYRTEDHMAKVLDKLPPEVVTEKHSVDAAEADLVALAEGARIRTINDPRSYLIDQLTSKVERREVVLP